MEEGNVKTLRRSSRSRSNTPIAREQDTSTVVSGGKRASSSNAKQRRQSNRQKSKLTTVTESQHEVITERVINRKIEDDDSDSSVDFEDYTESKRSKQNLDRARRRLELNGAAAQNEDSHSLKNRKSFQKEDQQKTSDYSSEEFEPGLAYQIYKKAGDWWNKFPKTDYTYSPASEHRKEVAPGVYPMPNMSRRPLHPAHLKSTPELKRSSTYNTTKSSVHENTSRFIDSRTSGAHTRKRMHNWEALDSDVDEIAETNLNLNTSPKSESGRFTYIFTSIWSYIYMHCTNAVRHISGLFSQSSDDASLRVTPERDMSSSSNWLERIVTWFYMGICSLMTVDVWILSKFHGIQTDEHNNLSRPEHAGYLSGDELDDKLIGKQRRYWRLLLLLLPIFFVIGLLGFYQPIGLQERDKIATPETWSAIFLLPFSVASTLVEKLWYSGALVSGEFIYMVTGAAWSLWSTLAYWLWFPFGAVIAWKEQLSASEQPALGVPVSTRIQQQELDLDALTQKVLSSGMLKQLIAEQMAHNDKIVDDHQRLLLQVSSELKDMQQNLQQLSGTTNLEKKNIVKMQMELDGMQEQIRQFQASVPEKMLMEENKASQQQEININSVTDQILANEEFQQVLTAQIHRESSKILENTEHDIVKHQKLLHDQGTVIQQLSENLRQVRQKLEQLNANMDDIQERELVRDETLQQVQQHVQLLQVQHMRHAQLYNRCCRQNNGFVLPEAVIEQKVAKAVVNILSNSTGRQFSHPDDIGIWINSLLVANSELEAKLSNVTSTLKLHTRDTVQRSKELLLLTISDRIQEEIAKWQRQSVFNTTIKLNKHTYEGSSALSDLQVRAIVDEALTKYDADKTGLVDYALESSGGSIVSIRCTETYQARTALVGYFGILMWYHSNSPRTAIQPKMHPGECWAFRGSQGYLVIKLSTPILITSFSMEHIPRSLDPTGRIDSAPKDFRVLALKEEQDESPVLLGRYMYQQNGTSLQYFMVQHAIDEPYDMVELDIESNHGNMEYTCLYRFRVHGKLANQ